MATFGILDFSEISDRFSKGQEVKEEHWDYITVPNTAFSLKEKYHIEFENEFIPDSNQLCNDLFQAGMEMFLSGVYDVAKGRVAKFTEEEVKESLGCATKEMILGSDRESVVCKSRPFGSRELPILVGGPTSVPISEKLHAAVMESYAQESCVDLLIGGMVTTFNGYAVSPDSAEEIYATDAEVRTLHEASATKGRHGMGILAPMVPVSNAGRLSSDFGYPGMSKNDLHYARQLNEVKIDSSVFTALSAWKMNGDRLLSEQIPLMGAYVTTPEETAICDIASTLASFVLFGSDIHLDGPTHINYGSTTTKETLQISGHVGKALDMNTDCLLANQIFTMAGPCTDMCLLEIAAQTVVDTVAGREMLVGVASAKGSQKDKVSGMEAKMMGKTMRACIHMNAAEANYVVESIVSQYASNKRLPSSGKKFRDCYDLTDITPTKEYVEVYNNTKEILKVCGLTL